MDFSSYATNEQAEDEGVWQPVGDSEFLVARYNNPNFQVEMQRLYTENKKELDAFNALTNPTVEQTRASKELTKKLHNRALQKTILLGWKNVQLNKVDLPYSEENAMKMLNMRAFMNMIVGLATKDEAYALELEDDDAKNSQLPLTGI